MFTPSKYQKDIFNFVERGQGNAVVDALAGSGKTTSLVQAARLVREEALFVAFNRHIAQELDHKLAGTRMTASTIHSLGLRCVSKVLPTRPKVEDRKYSKLVGEYVRACGKVDPDERDCVTERLRDLVRFCQVTLTDPTDPAAVNDMAARYGVDVEYDWEGPAAAEILLAGEDQAREGLIEFNDMVWLPERWGLTPPQVGYVFVDELQDLNAAQQALVLKAVAPGGRFLGVGDPRQAIYSFAGADAASFENMAARTGSDRLPLSICYRCPKSHIALAAAIVPHIEAREGAPDGVVETIKADALFGHVQPGDMVLCRLTAPLVRTCLDLIRNRVHARVRGRDIGASLGKMIRAVEKMPGYSWRLFPALLQRYTHSQVERLLARDASPARIDSLHDQTEAILACYETADAKSAGELSLYIEGLFDDSRPAVLLSTVHRAKGLENNRMFILEPDKLPLRWAKQRPEELEQEYNLKYVALTRAKEYLCFVEG